MFFSQKTLPRQAPTDSSSGGWNRYQKFVMTLASSKKTAEALHAGAEEGRRPLVLQADLANT